jgi:hypothetical protein
MGNRIVTWTQRTKSTMKETKQFGLTTFGQPCSVADVNNDFCNMVFFSAAGQVHELHPEAKRTLSSWAKKDLEALIFETACGHLKPGTCGTGASTLPANGAHEACLLEEM